jgi:pentatricopeptide repeat protein
MKSANQKTAKWENEMVTRIEKDLSAARREGRFDDALYYFEEMLAVHMNTESEPVKARCAALLAAPETLQRAA